ncbi:MAG: molybdopterin cofactor-binding domain-containing protein [Longimicrobiales bacterium]|nr:molybdopterin cofactor-binding domain-containing protein [Longimicrobiales bacterium]
MSRTERPGARPGERRTDLGPFAVDRRDFFKFTGGGIAVLVSLRGAEAVAAGLEQQRGYPDDFNAYLRIGEDGRVTVLSGKIEMGQGVETSQAQMVAEELDVPLDAIDMVMGDTARCVWDAGTWGSLTTRVFGPALRAAAARARQALLELAAGRLGVPAARLETRDGVVAVVGGQASLTYGELALGQRIEHVIEGEAALKAVSGFRVMGTSPQRLDAIAKVAGAARYAGDVRLPGMRYARILRPPTLDATLVRVDTAAAEALEGVSVVREEGLVAVLHEDPDVADRALAMLRAEFDVPEPAVHNDNIWDHFLAAAPRGRTAEERGSLTRGARECAHLFEHTWYDNYVAHAPMEPHTALASRTGDRINLWVSTQSPFGDQRRVAGTLGIDEEQVRVVTPYVGGGFGGKGVNPQAIEAARLAWITGQPVQVAWTREEEFLYDTFHAAALVQLRSGVDDAGRMHLWDYHVYMAGTRGSEVLYDIPHVAVVNHAAGGAHPLATGAWRAPGANTNVFARESQIDVMAAALGVDPLEFRLANTTDPRQRRVLETVAEAIGWTPAPGPSGRGWGFACGIDAGTYVAHAARVAVDTASGRVRVEKVVCAQDMGVVVNPDGAVMQMEGCITQGLGFALMEKINFRGGNVLDRNFDSYRIPRFSDVPEIETILVKNDETPSQGGGEPAIINMGAVVANAVFDACGARLHTMPMTPADVRAALAEG